MTLRRSLALLVAGTLVPLLAFSAIAVYEYDRQQSAAAEQALLDATRVLVVALDKHFEATITALRVLGTSEHLDAGALRAFHQQCRRALEARPEWRTISLFDLTGRRLLITTDPFGTSLPGPPPVMTEPFQRLVESRTPNVSDVFRSPLTGKLAVSVGVPVLRGGEVRWVISVGMAPDPLPGLLASQRIPPEWTSAILDRRYLIVARSRAEQVIAEPAAPGFEQTARAALEGTFRGRTREGALTLIAFSRSPAFGWTASIAVPDAGGIFRGPVQAILAVGAALLLIGVVVAVWAGRRISRPIEALAVSSRQLGRGEIVESVPSAVTEIAALSTALVEAGRDRADAETSLARYAERLEILHDIDRAIIAADAPVMIAEAALLRLRDLLGVPRVIVNLFDLAAGEAEWMAAVGRRRTHAGPGVRFSMRLMGDVDGLRRGEVQVIDADAMPPGPDVDALLASGVHVYMVVPMIADGELIGGLSFGGAPNEFPPEHVKIAQEVAAQLAIAIAQARLRDRVMAAEEQYRAIFEQALEGMFRSTADGRYLLVNPAMATIFGYDSPEEMVASVTDIGRQLYVNAEERQEITRLLAEHGAVSSFQGQALRKDGGIIWVSQSVHGVHDERGALRFYEGVVEDITERRRAEETAAALAEVSRTLSRSTDPDTVSRLAAENLCRLLSAGSAAVFRVEENPDALVRVTVAGPAPDAFLWFPRLEGARYGMAAVAVREHGPVASPDVLADSRVSYSAEFRAILEEKPDRAVLAVPLFVRERNLGALMVAARTGRVFTDEEMALAQAFADQAAQAFDTAQLVADLRTGRDFLASIAQNSADAIVTTDVDGQVTYFSPGAERLFGHRADEVMGRQAGKFYASGLDEARAVMRRLLAEGQITEYETTVLTEDGRARDVSSSISLLRDAGGATTGTLSVIRDITERKRMEASLRQSEKLGAMGSLLAGVAHELNNPLSIVAGHAHILKQSATDQRLVERAQKMSDAVDRCARIIKNFLALARQAPPERASVDLNKIIREAVELIAYPLRVDSIEVALELAPHLPVLWADGHQLHQVVVNLVTNAHQALRDREQPRRLTVTTRVGAGKQAVHFEVADNGPGMPAEVRERIFEPFFTTKPVGKGTGLGLSLCQSIIADHGGTMEVASEPGHGAVFSISLPVRAPDASNAADRPPEEAAALPPCRILIVDDEAEVAELLAEMLEAGGHRADTVTDGMAALEKLAERPYDVVLSDLRMPNLDGPALYREVERRYPQLKSRFVFITGDALGEETRTFLEGVSVPHLGKPFSAEDVLRVLRHVLVRSGRM